MAVSETCLVFDDHNSFDEWLLGMLKNTSQLVLFFPDVSLTISLEWGMIYMKTTEVKCFFHHILPRIRTINMMVLLMLTFNYLTEVIFADSLLKNNLFPLSMLYFLALSYYVQWRLKEWSYVCLIANGVFTWIIWNFSAQEIGLFCSICYLFNHFFCINVNLWIFILYLGLWSYTNLFIL